MSGGSVYTQPFGVIVPRVTGSISTCSSFAIIYLIATSESGLKSVYHRLMLGLSISDIIASVAMSLTTLPMPTPEVYPIARFQFVGSTRLGNFQTCTAQGFCYVFGSSASYTYTGCLCVYFACSIGFRIHQKKIEKKVEPFLHMIPIGWSLLGSVPFLFLEMYNYSNGNPWCTLVSLPNWCTGSEDAQCVRGVGTDGPAHTIIAVNYLSSLAIIIIVIFTSLAFVLRNVRRQHNLMKKYLQQRGDEETEIDPVMMREIKTTQRAVRVVTIQSLAYVSGFLLTIIFVILAAISPIFKSFDNLFKNVDTTLRQLKVFFVPMQGFFNFLIFAGSKLDAVRQANPEISLCDAIRKVFSRNTIDERVEFVISTGILFREDEEGFVQPYSSFEDDIDWLERNQFSNNQSAGDEQDNSMFLESNVIVNDNVSSEESWDDNDKVDSESLDSWLERNQFSNNQSTGDDLNNSLFFESNAFENDHAKQDCEESVSNEIMDMKKLKSQNIHENKGTRPAVEDSLKRDVTTEQSDMNNNAEVNDRPKRKGKVSIARRGKKYQNTFDNDAKDCESVNNESMDTRKTK